ncbi:hypothetical protein [Streptococcus cuniculi]|uniref:Uncharacterized protein n=1 Tax=Streptococcus cuniculi TaxID=1432788 RepID=A0A4Y9J8C4_9STRE|nr:hypothetical protein [Streptococcus cuniculi]MBF0778970.1 hypothetical protein [Streptococcus cuniculi]TFU97122.1 hypothetical protein E4T82_09590 [Streptococcus cuniculi]
MEELKFQYDKYFDNATIIATVVYEVIKKTGSGYIYLSNLLSYSKYEGDLQESITRRDKLIDFNADTRFNHFTEVTIKAFFDYLYQCQYIEECTLILTNRHYTVEELYRNLAEYRNIVLKLDLIEGTLYHVKFSECINSDSLKQSITNVIGDVKIE